RGRASAVTGTATTGRAATRARTAPGTGVPATGARAPSRARATARARTAATVATAARAAGERATAVPAAPTGTTSAARCSWPSPSHRADLRFCLRPGFLAPRCDVFGGRDAVMSEPTGHRPSHGAGVPPVPAARAPRRGRDTFPRSRPRPASVLPPAGGPSPVDDDLVAVADLREDPGDGRLVPHVDAAVRGARVAPGREVGGEVHGLPAAEEHRVRHGRVVERGPVVP